MVKKVRKQSTYDMEEDAPVQQAAATQGDNLVQQAAAVQSGAVMDRNGLEQVPAVGHETLYRKCKPRKRGQGTATQKRRKQLRLDKALGVADKKSTKAFKLSTAKQRKQQAKGLWSKAE
ncbi:hypothetical protein ABBQ32_002009 [Trebouxia sp. C0010 RCD-2024]